MIPMKSETDSASVEGLVLALYHVDNEVHRYSVSQVLVVSD